MNPIGKRTHATRGSDLADSQSRRAAKTTDGQTTVFVHDGWNVIAHFEYDSFGNTVMNTDTAGLFNYKFSAKPLDLETGFYYYGYRYYDPLTGRWPSRDPIKEKGGVNLVAFIKNSPIQHIDLVGLIRYRISSRAVMRHDHYYEDFWSIHTLGNYGVGVQVFRETARAHFDVRVSCNSGIIALKAVYIPEPVVYVGGSELDTNVSVLENFFGWFFSREELLGMAFSGIDVYSGRRYMTYEQGTMSAEHLEDGYIHGLFYGGIIYEKPLPSVPKWFLGPITKIPVFGTAFAGINQVSEAIKKLLGPTGSYRSKGGFSIKFKVCCGKDDELIFADKTTLSESSGKMTIAPSLTVIKE